MIWIVGRIVRWSAQIHQLENGGHAGDQQQPALAPASLV